MKVRRTHSYELYRKSSLSVLGIPSSKREIVDIIKAWFVISFIFAILDFRKNLGVNVLALVFTEGFAREFAIAGITVGIGFLLHELSHKIVAQRYGCAAEFRSDDMMLLVAFLMATFLGFVFIAPGATVIAGRVKLDQAGKIAIAGPVVNLVIAMAFVLMILSPVEIAKEIGTKGYFINVFLAAFNLIPFWILDGKKIWDWNKLIWFGTMVLCLLLLIPFFVGA